MVVKTILLYLLAIPVQSYPRQLLVLFLKSIFSEVICKNFEKLKNYVEVAN